MNSIQSGKLVILATLILLFAFAGVQPVSACSGNPPPWSEWLPDLVQASDVIVIGEYDVLDDAAANGIFRVDSYLSGAGSEYLLIQNQDRYAVENSLHVGRFYSACYSSEPLQMTQQYIYFLTRQPEGIYTINHYEVLSLENSITVNEGEQGIIELTLDTVIAQITTQTGHALQQPDTEAAYPRTTPILITTTNDQHFILPVDTLELVSVPDDEVVDLLQDQTACSSPPCVVYSPNGMDKVYLWDDEAEHETKITPMEPVEHNATGQRVVFSSTSETYAVWNNDQIELYMLWYPRLGYPDDPLESWYSGERITTIPAGNSIDYPVAWSPDGRTLAFSTDEGLWLWDALTLDYPPQLVIPTEDEVPTARYFSPQGRYLAVTEGNRRYTLDLVTLRELPDGYVSPDDRTLLVFDTQADSPTTLEVMYLAPGIRQSEFYPEVSFLNVQWIDTVNFWASITGSSYLETGELLGPFKDEAGHTYYESVPAIVEEPFYDVVQYHSSGVWSYQVVPYWVDDAQMQDFVYTPGPGIIKISVDGYHLSINEQLIALDTVLSEPIQAVAWLPSGFYFATD